MQIGVIKKPQASFTQDLKPHHGIYFERKVILTKMKERFKNKTSHCCSKEEHLIAFTRKSVLSVSKILVHFNRVKS
jgi:hypothetical protein